MSQNSISQPPFRQDKRRAGIAAALLLGFAGLPQPAAHAGSSELLGASRKSVSKILGDGQPLENALFNEESSEHHSGGIGSTHAYRTRIGYLGDRSCYAFFMKKTGETFDPVEVIGLLYLCASRAEWRELEVHGQIAGFIHQPKNSKGLPYLATLDDSAHRLFVYSPRWRPDFDRELWITPDEAPVHGKTEPAPILGKSSRPSSSKNVDPPGKATDYLFGKGGGKSAPAPVPASKGKQAGSDPKQGIYLPKENKVVPADPGKKPKTKGKGSRKRDKKKRKEQRQTRRPSIPPSK